MERLVHVATVSMAHGIKGEVKLHCHLHSPASLKNLKHFFKKDGKPIDVAIISANANQVIARIEKTSERTSAEALRGLALYAPAEAFPPTNDDEYYGYELTGMAVVGSNGETLGEVVALHNFGAGDILEIRLSPESTDMLPFSNEVFPHINRETRCITYQPPIYI